METSLHSSPMQVYSDGVLRLIHGADKTNHNTWCNRRFLCPFGLQGCIVSMPNKFYSAKTEENKGEMR